MRRTALWLPFLLTAMVVPMRNAPADPDEPEPTPVSISVAGTGEIRIMVADGASRPCDASGNKMLLSEHVKAGTEIKLSSKSGSICVDHTYGEMRESEWAGASIWSGVAWPGAPVSAIRGTVSTDEP
jgi:hypothetical protein